MWFEVWPGVGIASKVQPGPAILAPPQTEMSGVKLSDPASVRTASSTTGVFTAQP